MREQRNYNGKLMEKGKKNEEVIIKYMQETFVDCEVFDVSDVKKYQDMEVDVLVSDAQAIEWTYELKSDGRIGVKDNLFFEVQRINHSNKDFPQSEGWGYKSKADQLWSRNPDTGDTFIFNFEMLRKRIGEIFASPDSRHIQYKVIATDSVKTTLGLVIPMHLLRDYYTLVNIPQ